MFAPHAADNLRMETERTRRMRRWWALLVLLIPLLLWLTQQIGPRARMLESPVERLNREHADLWPNAADVYCEFQECLPEWPQLAEEFPSTARDPLPPELVAWVEHHEFLAMMLREAAAREPYYYPIEVSAGLSMFRQLSTLRTATKYLVLRAQLAAQRQDLATFQDSLLLAHRVSQHAFQQPLVIPQVLALACAALPQDWLLAPFEWPGQSPQALLYYIQAVRPLCDDSPLKAATWRGDVEVSSWELYEALPWRYRLLVSRDRLCGEMLRAFQPLEKLLAESIESRATPNNLLVAQIAAGPPPPTLAGRVLNFPRALASGYFFTDRTVQFHARVVAMQRGNRTCLAIFEHRLSTGEWPTSLPAGSPLEPYTGWPYIYRLSADGFTLYAAGLDRDDDGGRHEERFGESPQTTMGPLRPPNGDCVFWPIPETCPNVK